jgi:phage shock protein PspC (stress-responsive transcriptional regulator)
MILAVQPPPEQQMWLYERDGQRFGPTDLGGLQIMADSWHLLPECKVLPAGGTVPGRAADIEGLVFPAEPPPLPRTDSRYDRLYRSSDERMVLGVCAGLAHRWSVPVLAVRTAVVLLMPLLMGWAYLLGVFLPAVPTKPEPVPPPPLPPPQPPPPAPALPAGPNMTSA